MEETDVDRAFKKSTLPFWFFVLILAIVIGLFFTARYSISHLPDPVYIKDENEQHGRFIGERAYNHVHYLSKNITYRFVGTDNNEIKTVNYLKDEIEKIQRTAHPKVKLELSHQISDGQFVDNELKYLSINVYENLQNIILKVSSIDAEPNYNWMLLNSHFDAVPMSPGAGDDGTMVGVMLELIRVLAQKPILTHPVLFLFNGCEEHSKQASHSFITNHEWMKNVKLLINLEVAGPGGKDLVFQTSPRHAWLMDAYRKSVPNPFAFTIAEEVYQSGIIASDTDYTQFRLYADPYLAAFDVAHIRNGYVYHTKNDAIEYTSMEVFQNTGNNILALIKELDTRKELDDIQNIAERNAKVVFFDYLGLFVVYYDFVIGVIINVSVVAALFLIIAWNLFRIKEFNDTTFKRVLFEYMCACLIEMLGFIIALAFTIGMAYVIDGIGKPLTWFSNTWIVYGFYYMGFYIVMSFCSMVFIKYRESKTLALDSSVQLHLHGHATILAILLIIMTSLKIGSGYIMMMGLFFYSSTCLLNMIFRLDQKGSHWIYLHLVGQVLPVLYYLSMANLAAVVLIPTTGRSYEGASTNPEYMIGILSGLICYITFGFIAPTASLFKYTEYVVFGVLGSLFGITFIFMVSFGVPYDKYTALQRFQVWHSELNKFDYNHQLLSTDTGYYIYSYDRNGVQFIKDEIPLLREMDSLHGGLNTLCKTEILCGIPHYLLRYVGNVEKNVWLKRTDHPKFDVTPQLELISTEKINALQTKYFFKMSGTHHMSLHISPLPNAKLVSWSFDPSIKEEYKIKWNNRDVYFINYVKALDKGVPYTLELVFEKPLNWNLEYTFDIALVAHFIHKPLTHTNEFTDFVKTFPEWTTLQYWTSYYATHQIN